MRLFEKQTVLHCCSLMWGGFPQRRSHQPQQVGGFNTHLLFRSCLIDSIAVLHSSPNPCAQAEPTLGPSNDVNQGQYADYSQRRTASKPKTPHFLNDKTAVIN